MRYTCAWLQPQIKRRHCPSRRPRYDLMELRACVKEGKLPQAAPEATSSGAPSHSHYGCKALLDLYLEQPAVLVPSQTKVVASSGAARGTAEPQATAASTKEVV